MDAKKFFEEARRMCGKQERCRECPALGKDAICLLLSPHNRPNAAKNIDKAIEAVEKWSQENPRKEAKQNMDENKHGFEPKQEFTMGGIAWTVIQTGKDWIKCIASECVEECAFDEGNKNNFFVSSLRDYLNCGFLRRLIQTGVPGEMFEYFNIDLTADDGLKNYGSDRVRIGLITCNEYRLLRGNIPAIPNRWWWTATPDSPINNFVRYVHLDGTLNYNHASIGSGGVRPICVFKSELLESYLNDKMREKPKRPRKTRLMDFKGKYPNAQVNGQGLPYMVPRILGYCQANRCGNCQQVGWNTKSCWDAEVDSDE